ncbi:MAG TPA: YafY family transcriptional regulator [Planctomycetes bacterium]|nr:YafY family transcriptional regulator [Planctomycetota bacterium]
MRRADRLFQIIQILRRESLVTAAQLGLELEVSERTIYRDVRDLISSGVPIEGEAGVGYQLRHGFDLPPIMFDQAEIEALILGASMVEGWADPALKLAARSALSKVGAVLPRSKRALLDHPRLHAMGYFVDAKIHFGMGELRAALRNKHKCLITYATEDGQPTERTIWPLGLFFWGRTWTLAAWCELRDDYRNFRLDRMTELAVLPTTFEETGERSLADMLRRQSDC